VFVQVEKDTMK
jgi:hypothetical protein